MSYYSKPIFGVKPRVEFNPKNQKHILDFAKFVKYNNWKGGCSYFLEDPYSDIPAMIQAKIAEHTVSRYLEKV
jgi:hypothetical protein